MTSFKISVIAYIPAPRQRDYNITATSFGTAINRAIKQYRQEIGRKKIDKISINAIK
jgi:hypothetical protein